MCAVLEECLAKEVDELRAMTEKGSQLVLLDMENSVDVYDYSRPVAAAELLRRYLLDQWPSRDEERKLKEAKKAQPEVPSPSLRSVQSFFVALTWYQRRRSRRPRRRGRSASGRARR